MSVKNIDAGQLQSFTKMYNDAPENFELGLEAKTVWQGHGLGNLAKVGRWTLGGNAVEKATRDFTVQVGSWQEVGDAVGVVGADDRLEPVEIALTGLASCVSEAVTLNCARTDVDLEGLEVTAHLDVDPGPIIGAREPAEWTESMKQVKVDVTAHGTFSEQDKRMIEEGATRSPVYSIFSRALDVEEDFHYVA